MPAKKDLPEAEIVARYLAGESCYQLADAYNVTDLTIRNRLSNLGIDRRPQGEAIILRASNRADSPRIGKYEKECIQWLEELGYTTRVQVNQSNRFLIDIVVDDFAIEVWAAKDNPANEPKQSKKIRHLINQGWNVVYLWSGRNRTITRETIVELDNYMRQHNGAPGSYYCIRGTRTL